jgi:hypothetical protein
MIEPAARLRRLGYATRIVDRTLLADLIEDGDIALRPMNRADPRQGHHVGDCPRCGARDALWVEPGWRQFSTSCRCWRGNGGPFALFRLMTGSAR